MPVFDLNTINKQQNNKDNYLKTKQAAQDEFKTPYHKELPDLIPEKDTDIYEELKKSLFSKNSMTLMSVFIVLFFGTLLIQNNSVEKIQTFVYKTQQQSKKIVEDTSLNVLVGKTEENNSEIVSLSGEDGKNQQNWIEKIEALKQMQGLVSSDQRQRMKEKRTEKQTKQMKKVDNQQIKMEEENNHIDATKNKVVNSANTTKNHYIQIAALSKKPTTDFLQKLKNKHLPFVVKQEKPNLFKVYVGPYDSYETAKNDLTTIKTTKVSTGAFVVTKEL